MKKVLCCVICLIELICLVCVCFIGGMAGAYAWSFAAFIVAPVAVLSIIVQGIILFIKLYKKKIIKWNIIIIVISLIMAYPITFLLGISNITYPTKASGDDKIDVTMPVKCAVLFGGKDYKTHAIWPSECYAYDLLVEPYDTGSDDLNSYGVYGADVIAPISGTIIGMENSEEDIPPNTDEFTSLLGNYVFIEIDSTGTYLILAHLKKNSIKVSIGDYVAEGEYIGKVGNSGTTSEPHLHIQHQRNNPLNMIFPTCAEGLPIIFK